MTTDNNTTHTLRLKDSDLGITKIALEYLFINAKKAHLCVIHQKELAKLLNKVTKITDGKSLFEQMADAKE